MPEAKQTFGSYLHHFVLAFDIVDNHTFKVLWNIIQNYLSSHLGIDYLALKWEKMVNNNPGLITVEGSEEEKQAYTLLTLEGEYTGPTSYAFINKKPLWVLDINKDLLSSPSSKHVDYWSGAEDFPKNPELKRDDIKTSIFVPVAQNKRTIGIVEFEAKSYIEATEIAKKELNSLANTTAKIHLLRELHTLQSNNTRQAIESIQRALQEGNWPELTKPQMFVAASSKAPKPVYDTIKKVLDGFKDRIDVVYWDNILKAGNVNEQIFEAISKSKFGLCYFSEPVDRTEEYRYRDNLNVIFEAGMLQSLIPPRWIPVREKSSPEIPFDFATERIFFVERYKRGENKGRLNESRFIRNLKSRVEALIGDV